MPRIFALGLVALSLLGCGGGRPIEVKLEPKPSPDARTSSDVIAARPAGREVVVDAKNARTALGHVARGSRVHISVVEAQWSNAASGELFGTEGGKENCQASGGHVCATRDDATPIMALVLISESSEQVAASTSCAVRDRLFAANGIEFEVPEDMELFLAPNDWEDGLSNNRGALEVLVEVSPSKSAKSDARRVISVSAQEPRTLAGRLARGRYVRVTPQRGKWSHDPNAELFASEGSSKDRCLDSGPHRCIGGHGAGPMMSLVALVSPCRQTPAGTQVRAERRPIPWGVDFVADRDLDLFLAPNDWEDGLFDNRGSARVVVEVTPALAAASGT